MGAFFRYYLYAIDREELQINRAQHSWFFSRCQEYRQHLRFRLNTKSGGEQLSPGCELLFPILEEASAAPNALTTVPAACHAGFTPSILRMVEMSYDTISGHAVLALSRDRRMAGCSMNIRKGSASQWHLEGVRELEGNLFYEKLREL